MMRNGRHRVDLKSSRPARANRRVGQAVRLRHAGALSALFACGALFSAPPLAAHTSSGPQPGQVSISIPAAGKGEIKELTVTGTTKAGASGALVHVTIANLATLNPNIRAASLIGPPVRKGSKTTVTIFVAVMNVTGIVHARAISGSRAENPGDTVDLIVAGAAAAWGGGVITFEHSGDTCSEYLVLTARNKANGMWRESGWVSLGSAMWKSPGPEIATNAQAHDSSCK